MTPHGNISASLLRTWRIDPVCRGNLGLPRMLAASLQQAAAATLPPALPPAAHGSTAKRHQPASR
eukprot:scaffold89656_cov57-Phaeocystis_antarctica.AAC.1